MSTRIASRAFAALLAAGLVSVGAASSATAQGQPEKHAAPAQPAHKIKLEKVAKGGEIADQESLVGKKALDFTLTDTEGTEHTLSTYLGEGKIVVLEWFNPGCPYVVKHHEKHSTMRDLASKYEDQGVVWLAVNSGPNETAEGNQSKREAWSIEYPVLLDSEGDVGKAYGSKNTPTMYVIDKEGVIQYVGAIDSDASPSKLGDVNYVAQALDAILADSNVETAYSKPYGCNVKYKKTKG
ncbi:MAG TPA: redoxin domain-containing protein [Phycisphaerales bacterium]|nr:redoxin domain-containing protein [Phycisphaerales bacterium]